MEILKNDRILKQVSLGYSFLRSAHFAAQGFMLPWIELMATGQSRKKPMGHSEFIAIALPKLRRLFEQDAQNIADGLYPMQVLEPENPVKHLMRIPAIVGDAFRAARRRKDKQAKEFKPEFDDVLGELPEYYRRNFHFQSDGYLGESSARLYEHQVEVLFSGSADAMRRSSIRPLKDHFQNSDGEGLHFLEIGSGTGRLTKFMAMAFPKAKITCVDLSSYYMKAASQQLSKFHRINFMQGAGEKLPFQAHSFDAVYSCFLFHELPREVREQMVREGRRVLKNGGMYVVSDSLQMNDDKEMNWALKQFPLDFHEPFFKDYVQSSLEELFEKTGLKNVSNQVSFLTKTVSGVLQ